MLASHKQRPYLIKLIVIKNMTRRIPESEIINMYSAICSNLFSFVGFSDLIEKKEKKHDIIKKKAISEVNSSIWLLRA